MRVTLASRYDWPVPGKRAVICFEPGTHTMTRQQADDAIAAGVGRPAVDKPRRTRGRATD